MKLIKVLVIVIAKTQIKFFKNTTGLDYFFQVAMKGSFLIKIFCIHILIFKILRF